MATVKLIPFLALALTLQYMAFDPQGGNTGVSALGTIRYAPAEANYLPLPVAQNKPSRAQGSIGKWPGGNKAPSLIVTIAGIVLLAGAIVAFGLLARRQKTAERESAARLRRSRDNEEP